MIDYTQSVADEWVESAYYDLAEDEGALRLFWGEETVFFRLFKTLDLTNILEVACGHGRHVQKYIEQAGQVTISDVNRRNIDYCALRFATSRKRPKLVLNERSNLSTLESGSFTAIFSYDAMVHFELFDVAGYVTESWRLLKPEGRALFHHSNFDGAPGLRGSALQELGWRNFMNCRLFAHLALRAGFEIVEQSVIAWGGIPNLDCVSLLRKPRKSETR